MRIIKDAQCGLYFKSGDFEDLAEKCVTIYKNVNQYGFNGQQAVLSKYNWENDERRLLNVISSMAQSDGVI